jgi:hypothetical protein
MIGETCLCRQFMESCLLDLVILSVFKWHWNTFSFKAEISMSLETPVQPSKSFNIGMIYGLFGLRIGHNKDNIVEDASSDWLQ